MAELVLTEAEKAADSYLEWEDSALANMVRYLALVYGKTDEDKECVVGAASVANLIGNAIKFNAARLNIEQKGLKVKGVPHGDWEVFVRKVRNPDGKLVLVDPKEEDLADG